MLELELGEEFALLMEGDFVYSQEHVDDMEAAYVKVCSRRSVVVGATSCVVCALV